MKNVGLAVTGYATTNNGAIPPLAGGIDSWNLDPTGSTVYWAPAPWTVHLLPYLEQAGLSDRLTNKTATAPTAAVVQTYRDVNIKVFTCPDDQSSDDAGAMSFSANAGYIGSSLWTSASTDTTHRIQANNSSGTQVYYLWTSTAVPSPTTTDYGKMALSTGVFWRQDSSQSTTSGLNLNPTSLKMTLDRMRDGTSQTLMLSENLSNGGWLAPTQLTSSSVPTGPATGEVAFGLCVTDSTAGTPNYGLDNSTGNIGNSGFTLSATTFSSSTLSEQSSRINNNLTATSGAAPRPSSLHPQVVNTIFCDGSGRVLSQSIADSVYARLLSPNGNVYNQQILSGTDY
jgi:hypothetical protein